MSDRMAGLLDIAARFLQGDNKPNRMMAGAHPGDAADLSAMQLAPHMAKGLVNDVAKYGSQTITGKVSDNDFLQQQPLTGQAKTIADAAGSAMGTALNYQVPSLMRGSRSVMDDLSMVADGYRKVKPSLVELLGEPAVNRAEGAGLLGSMVIPGRANKLLDAPTVNRDMDLLQRVGDVDSVNTMRLDVEPGVELTPESLVKAQDLEGRGFVSGMADTSRGDLSRVVAVNDQPIDMVRHGGVDYMRQPQNAEKGILWASDVGQVSGLTNAAKAAELLPGVLRSPLYLPYGMGGKSTDFATMTADVMVPMAKANLKKKDKKLLDKRIRQGSGTKTNEFTPQPDWPGIDSPEVDKWLASAGGNRKAVQKAIDEFRDEAGINLSQARAAIVDPTQLDPRVGDLRSVGIMDMVNAPRPGNHPSYNTDIMGSYLGRFGKGANLLSDLNPMIRTTQADFRQEMIKRGHNVDAQKVPSAVGKTMQPGLIGSFDQATLDELIKKGFIAP